MDLFFDSIFHGLFTTLDPLGMVLRTLMGLLSDALAAVATGLYGAVFEVTTIEFSLDAVRSIWLITTGVSASLATIMLLIAGFRSLLAQNNGYLMAALPGVGLAILGPQGMTILLPALSVGITSLAKTIVAAATPDLAASMRLLAGFGTNPIYEGLGLLAPVIAGMLLWGLTTVFFVLLFCMAAAIVLYVMSPFAFAGLVMAPTRTWFITWARSMFAVLFAKVPIAIILALAAALFANSAHTGIVQSFVNAGTGLILGLGALLAPLLAFGMFGFMSTVVTRPPVPSGGVSRGLGTAYYGSQMGRSAVDSLRSAGEQIKTNLTTRKTTTATADGNAGAKAGPAADSVVPAPVGRPTTTSSTPPASAPGGAPTGATVGGSSSATAASSKAAASGGAAAAGGSSAAAAAAAAGAGPVGAVVVGAQAAKAAAHQAKDTTTNLASDLSRSPDASDDSPGGSMTPPSQRTTDLRASRPGGEAT